MPTYQALTGDIFLVCSITSVAEEDILSDKTLPEGGRQSGSDLTPNAKYPGNT